MFLCGGIATFVYFVLVAYPTRKWRKIKKRREEKKRLERVQREREGLEEETKGSVYGVGALVEGEGGNEVGDYRVFGVGIRAEKGERGKG